MVQAIQFRGSPSGEIIQKTSELPDIQPDEVQVKVTQVASMGVISTCSRNRWCLVMKASIRYAGWSDID